jgi:hypothetical protein
MKYFEREGIISDKIPYKEPTIIINKHVGRAWYHNGVPHREDGPAIVWDIGRKFWWYQGKFLGHDLTLKQFQSYIKMKAFW